MVENHTVNKLDKTMKDYYDQMYALFPDVPKEDVRRICNYGWKALYLHNSYGGDTIITDSKFWSYIGFLKKDSLKWFFYYIKKLTIKLRVLYKRKRIKWDGYYYFALTDNQYENYLSQKNKRGRPRKYYSFGNHFLYKILDECKIREFNRKYIFRIPYITDLGIKLYKKDLVSDKAELIITRDTQKFKDILINNNNYEFI